MADNQKIAELVLKAVGGKENIISVTHCMTRLRLVLKDTNIPNDKEVKEIDGVLSVVNAGGQYQVVIGQNVPKVHAEICKLGGFSEPEEGAKVQAENRKKKTWKDYGSAALNYVSGSVTALIPILVAGAMFRTIMVVFGPGMLNLFTAESDTYVLLDFIYDAAFYFIPIYLGYAAAKKLGASPVLGMMMGGILIAPDFVQIAGSGESFTVFGIPCITNVYSQSVLPMILSMWVLYHVEKIFKKIIPDTLSTIFTPFLTMLVMVPVSLCLLAPAGAVIGNYISGGLIAFGNVAGPLGVAVIAALWCFLVMTGMHSIMGVTLLTILMTMGSEAMISPAANCATYACMGMGLGAFIGIKQKKEKSLCMGYFISSFIGGVSEPTLYGVGLKYKRPFIALMIGGFCGGLYAGFTHVANYVLGASNCLIVIGYINGGMTNLVNGVISCLIALGTTAICTYIGFRRSSFVADNGKEE